MNTDKPLKCTPIVLSNGDREELCDGFLRACYLFVDWRQAQEHEVEDRMYLTPDMLRVAALLQPTPVQPKLVQPTPEMAALMLGAIESFEVEKRIEEHQEKMASRQNRVTEARSFGQFVEEFAAKADNAAARRA